MKKQLPVSRSTRNSTIAGPSHSSARSNFNDASASAGSRASAIAITATPPVAGASFNRRCWNAATHSPLCSSISTPTPTPGQYSCSKTAPGPRPAVNPEILLDGDLSEAGDGRNEWRASATSARSPKKKQLLPEFRDDAASVRRPQRCAGQLPKSARAGISNCLPSDLRSATFLRFLLLIGLHQRHSSFSGCLFIANAFHLPCLARPNGPE